jgi:BRCT domain type II-containing protein
LLSFNLHSSEKAEIEMIHTDGKPTIASRRGTEVAAIGVQENETTTSKSHRTRAKRRSARLAGSAVLPRLAA